MTTNNIITLDPIGGGALPLNQQQNLERRNRGLSLLNQTAAHCISPSSCDNTTSLNDINLQLHASSTVSNPCTFNITKDIGFNATCTSENTITVTVGTSKSTSSSESENDTTNYFYGYSSNINTGDPVFGECSPSTYHGIKISSLFIQQTVQYTLQGPNVINMFYMSFDKHININSITINNSTYSFGDDHYDEATIGCIYIMLDGLDDIEEYFVNNVNKQIAITLE